MRTRPGTDVFYFRHTQVPRLQPGITREYLWPEQDVFVDMFETLLSAMYIDIYHPSGIALPKRLDLLDKGYMR